MNRKQNGRRLNAAIVLVWALATAMVGLELLITM